MDPVTLATAAVTFISPYLLKLATDGAAAFTEESAKAAGGGVVAWIKGKLGGRSAEALDELESAPQDSDNGVVLRKALEKALAADPKLAEELRALLPTDAVAAAETMTQTVSGAGAKAAQTKGIHNTTTIS